MTQASSRPSTLAVAVALGTVYIVWGSTYLAIAYVVETMPPLLSAAARFLAAGGLLVAFLLAQDRWRRRRNPAAPRLHWPSAVEWRTAFIVGALLLLGGNGMVVVAEQTIPSGIAAVIIATVPIWMSVFDALLTRRAPSLLSIGGLAVGLVGVAILLMPSAGVEALDPIGIGLLVVATISWASGSLYARRGKLPDNQLLGTGMEQLAGGLALVAAGLLLGELGRTDPAAFSVESLLGLGFLIVFGSLFAFTAYVWLLNHVPVTTVATYAYVNPVVAVALGVLFRGESLTLRTLLAAALIVGAVVAMVSGRPREVKETGPCPETAPMEQADDRARRGDSAGRAEAG
ncbi:MAG TPA: EamA family transporter [Candidatus Dormibacteraeota bacterium]|nr:EamA family transporter [Candidatus Dormibacteraeota bacterium]